MPTGWPYQQAPYPAYPEATPFGAGQAPYPFSGAAATGAMPGAPPAPGAAPFAPQMTREQELDFFKSQAEAIKGQLEQIESRMRDLETEE